MYQVEAERSGAFSRLASLKYASSVYDAATAVSLNALEYLAIYSPLTHQRGEQIDFVHLSASRRLRCEKCKLKIHRTFLARRECAMKPRHF